jgi:outer membrane protein
MKDKIYPIICDCASDLMISIESSINKPKGGEQMKDRKTLMRVMIGVSILCLVAGMSSMTQAVDFSIGAGAGMAPDYEGSDDYEPVPIPFAEAKFENGMYVKLEGLTLRANVIPSDIWRLGPVYNYRPSRSAVDNSKVDDLKNLSDANELGVFGGFEYYGWFANGEFLADIGDAHDGWLGTLKAGYNWKLSSWIISVGGSTTYASKDYMRTYFGIDAADSARSGLSTYDADKGIKEYGVDLGVNWSMTQSWSLRGIANYTRLTGDADDSSPVVDEGGALVVFTF